MIWVACQGEQQIKPVSGRLYRLVESQEQVATLGYVDTLEEQVVLESLLETAKPDYPDSIEPLHYLLTSPFRYPPLPYGSRFGRISEPSLFYAGCKPTVTLSESAFYRFVFIRSIGGVTSEDKMRSEHTLFTASYRTERGIQLQCSPFDHYQDELTDKQQYAVTQQLGTDMRLAGVEAFEYQSARDLKQGCCVALYHTGPFVQKTPSRTEQWLCETTIDEVSFKPMEGTTIHRFAVSQFLVDGVLPLPA